MEEKENLRDKSPRKRDEVYSKAVRAGKRTYFFDVKASPRNDYFITITESKKRFRPDGTYYYEKHKLLLYKEDFEKFTEGLNDVVKFVRDNNIKLSSESESNED